ncbi:MAG: PDZ domain-containing protein, partial [Flavobacteriales bacterium]|nr:PDZ domain-containing protein [Flavobacteriales bacterium]
SAHQAGDEVTVRYVRDGKKKKTKATLGERPLEDQVYRFNGFGDWEDYDGVNYLVFPEDIQEQWEREPLEVEIKPFLGVSPACGSTPGEGIELGSITTGSSAEEMGLMVGDRITGFNGKAINSFDELTEAIYEVAPGDEVRIDIVREGKDKKIKGEIGQRAYTSYDDTDIFREFKGCDENGKMEYHYEFDFDEKSLEEMVADLNRREAERQARLDEWAAQQVEAAEELHIFIEVDNISKEDLDQVNASAETPLKNDNDLPVEGISFYPNPNSGVINLNFSLNDRSAVDILIYNHLGSIIYKENVMNFNGSYQNLIDISKEADGTYFLQIMQGGKTYSKKLIKNS